jgi:hypothetical protein
MNIDSFTGAYYSLNLGADVGISVGMSASYSPIPNTNNFVLGYGKSLGLGLFLIDINLQASSIGTKKISKINRIYDCYKEDSVFIFYHSAHFIFYCCYQL